MIPDSSRKSLTAMIPGSWCNLVKVTNSYDPRLLMKVTNSYEKLLVTFTMLHQVPGKSLSVHVFPVNLCSTRPRYISFLSPLSQLILWHLLVSDFLKFVFYTNILRGGRDKIFHCYEGLAWSRGGRIVHIPPGARFQYQSWHVCEHVSPLIYSAYQANFILIWLTVPCRVDCL